MESNTPKLSKRAAKVLYRMHCGSWYPWSPKPTRAVQELIDAGLVKEMGRVNVVRLCYVPVATTPFQMEVIPRAPIGLVETVGAMVCADCGNPLSSDGATCPGCKRWPLCLGCLRIRHADEGHVDHAE